MKTSSGSSWLRTGGALWCAGILLLATNSFGAKIGERDITRSVLPLVAVEQETGDYKFLGNAVMMSDDGHLTAPAHVFSNIDPTPLHKFFAEVLNSSRIMHYSILCILCQVVKLVSEAILLLFACCVSLIFGFFELIRFF